MTIEVAAGLVFRDGKLLITQRYSDAHLGGLWEFPGGKREPKETFEECLHRELKEELGIEVRILNLVETITHDYPEKTVLLQFFRCAWLRYEPQSIGCPDFRWISREELANFEFPPADARLLGKLGINLALWQD
jgi:mutator protein MutT